MIITQKDRWTEADVLSLPLGEYDYLERKAGALVNDKDFEKDMAKAVSAIANSGGGYLLFGQKNDGSFDGLPPKQGRTPTREWLEQKLPHLVVYPLQKLHVHEVEPDAQTTIPTNTVVVLIEIPDSPLAPHQSAKDNLYYCRVGGHSKPAPHFYLEMLRGRVRFPNAAVVEAWFETVINPLLSKLSMQHENLRQKQWFFEQQNRTIKGVESLISGKKSEFIVTGNQEQFFETYPHVGEVFHDREDKFLEFQAQVAEFYKIIRESDAIYDRFKICTSPESLQAVRENIKDIGRGSLSDIDLRKEIFYGTDEQLLDYLAQCIINKIGKLNSDITVSPFWNTHREGFLSLLNTIDAEYHENCIKESVKLLLDTGLNLASLLEETRKQLSRQHGVPYYQSKKAIDSYSYLPKKYWR